MRATLPILFVTAVVLNGLPQLPAAQVPGEPRVVHVKIQRPMTVGQRFKEITTARIEQTNLTRGPGGVEQTHSTKRTIQFEADQEVMEITAKGAPKSYQIEFKRITEQQEGGKKEDLLKPGTVIIGSAKANGSVFRRQSDGEELDEIKQAILADLFGMSEKDEGPTLDDLCDNSKPHVIGDGWPINEAIARQWFQQPNDMRTIAGVSGESRLVGEVEVDGVKCYKLGHTLSARQRADGRFQAGGQAPETHFMSAMLSTLPADNISMERGYTSMKRFRYIIPEAREDGEIHTNEVVIESHYNTAISPLPSAPPKPATQQTPTPAQPENEQGQPEADQAGEEAVPGLE